jgi:hypothetical protein
LFSLIFNAAVKFNITGNLEKVFEFWRKLNKAFVPGGKARTEHMHADRAGLPFPPEMTRQIGK